MAENLTPGALTKLKSGTYVTNPVVQVKEIKCVSTSITVKGDKVEKKASYNLVLFDGSVCQQCDISCEISEMIISNEIQQGSIVQLTNFSINSIFFFIIKLKVIRSECDIIYDKGPFTHENTPSSGISKPPSINLDSCSQKQSKKRKGQSSDNITAAAKDTAKDVSMTMEKKTDDHDIAACFEKLEKIGWGTEDPLYDTALLLFVESAEYRKLWLLLKPESCEKWVKNVGRKLGLFS